MGGDRIILDSGALSAFASEKGRLRLILRRAIAFGAKVCVPSPVIAETTTGFGPRDTKTNRVLKECDVIPLDEHLARAAGALRYRRPKTGTIDAMIVACADAIPGSVVVTGDVDDLRELAAERNLSKVIDLSGIR